jgi:Tol biopolymer transport system component
LEARDALQDASDAKPVRLTDHPGLDSDPRWSPSGDQVVFASDRDGNDEIYVMDVEAAQAGEGSKALARLTDDPARDSAPVWAPDGEMIAFESDRGGDLDIYVIGPDGGTVRQLTRDRADDSHPAWSPDGRYIAYQSGRASHEEIYVVDVEDALESPEKSPAIRLTSHEGSDRFPVWSPDGTWLAYVAEGAPGLEIHAVRTAEALQDPVNAQRLRLARGLLYVQSPPVWSPEGTHMVAVAMQGLEAFRSLQLMYVKPVLEGAGRAMTVPVAGITVYWMPPVSLSWSPEDCDG